MTWDFAVRTGCRLKKNIIIFYFVLSFHQNWVKHIPLFHMTSLYQRDGVPLLSKWVRSQMNDFVSLLIVILRIIMAARSASEQQSLGVSHSSKSEKKL